MKWYNNIIWYDTLDKQFVRETLEKVIRLPISSILVCTKSSI